MIRRLTIREAGICLFVCFSKSGKCSTSEATGKVTTFSVQCEILPRIKINIEKCKLNLKRNVIGVPDFKKITQNRSFGGDNNFISNKVTNNNSLCSP